MWTSKWKGKPNMQFLSRFDTVQSFWSNFQAVRPSDLVDKSYLHIFKDGIAPLWEDPLNVNGGHFKLTANTPEGSLEMWQSIVLNLIGKQFPTDDCINGASIVVHGVGNNLIKLWLSNTDKETVAATKAFLEEILEPEHYLTDKITFVPHKLVLPSTNLKVPRKMGENNSMQESLSDDLPLAKKNAKRRKSRSGSTSSSSSSTTGKSPASPDRHPSLAVATMTAPVCCGPTEVRFAHDPYSISGGCTYLPIV
jgi:hypothetical protein